MTESERNLLIAVAQTVANLTDVAGDRAAIYAAIRAVRAEGPA
jgi:hypothetical protein